MAEASVTVPLTNGSRAYWQRRASRNERSLAAEIRFSLAEIERRDGSPVVERIPWPPALPDISLDNLEATKSQLAEWSEERDRLAMREGKPPGPGCLRADEQNRLAWLRDTIKTQQVRVDMLEGRPPSEPRRPGRSDLRGRSHG
jgi:hypothetical protein